MPKARELLARVRDAVRAGSSVGKPRARDKRSHHAADETLREGGESRPDTEPTHGSLLRSLSAELLQEGNTKVLYERIMDAAAAVMRSDFASMQAFHPERGRAGELRLLAHRGFSPQAARSWKWVSPGSHTTCGIALLRGKREIEPDIAGSRARAGTPDQATYLQTGIRSVQSTPLLARDGTLIGMISTHWKEPHQPAERDLRLLDTLAHQAAHLIERTRADEALRRLAAIVETSDDAIISKDLEGIIASWNRGAERLFGYTAREAIGRPVTMLMLPEQIDEEPGILARIRRGERIDHYETVRRRKDGTLLDISLSVSPIVDSDGKVVGASKIARDITDRKQAEAALREADRRKDEFLAMLSHELRNPLAPMTNAVELLKQGNDENAWRQASSILDRQLRHMTRLVEDLLDISRISHGGIEVRKHNVDLGAVVLAAIETSRPLVEAAGHRLHISLPNAPVSIVADRIRLSQVVANLLNNAAKYTPPGGHIEVKVSRGFDAAAVSVRDNGIGIPPGELPKLFEMFTQLDGSRRRSPGGLGVGLALARQLVELHGGTIEARSDGPGQGSEFTVRIPLPAADGRSGASA
jgi:PAS domain S-box-containing protein